MSGPHLTMQGVTRKKRSVLRRPPEQPSLGATSTPAKQSILSCFIGEAQSTKRSVVQTNLLGNNCFCVKANCNGVVHVVEMDRVLTAPCFDFPIYSIERRLLVKCNKCFYVSSLQAHRLNSVGSGKLPVVRLTRASPTIYNQANITEKTKRVDESSTAMATREIPVHRHHPHPPMKNNNMFEDSYAPSEITASSGIETTDDETGHSNTQEAFDKRKMEQNAAMFKRQEMEEGSEEISEIEAVGNDGPAQMLSTLIDKVKSAGSGEWFPGKHNNPTETPKATSKEKQDHTETSIATSKEKQDGTTVASKEKQDRSAVTSNEWQDHPAMASRDNVTMMTKEQTTMTSRDKLDHIAMTWQQKQDHTTRTSKVKPDHTAMNLKRKSCKAPNCKAPPKYEGRNDRGLANDQGQSLGCMPSPKHSSANCGPPEWLFVKSKDDGEEISAMQTLKDSLNQYAGAHPQVFRDPSTSPVRGSRESPTSRHRKKADPPSLDGEESQVSRPIKIPYDCIYSGETTERSDLIHYIAKATRGDNMSRDSPLHHQHVHHRSTGSDPLEEESDHFCNDPPMNDEPPLRARHQQEPGGTKAKEKDPKGRRKRGTPSLSSNLTNRNREEHKDPEATEEWRHDQERRRGEPARRDAPVHDFVVPELPKTPPLSPDGVESDTSDSPQVIRVTRPVESPGEFDHVGLLRAVSETTPDTPDTPKDDRREPTPRRSEAVVNRKQDTSGHHRQYRTNEQERREYPTRDVHVTHHHHVREQHHVRAHPHAEQHRPEQHRPEQHRSEQHRPEQRSHKVPTKIAVTKERTPMSLPAVDGAQMPLALTMLPRVDEDDSDSDDRTLDDIIKESITVLKQTIPRPATAIAPVMPDLPKKPRTRVRKAEKRRPEQPTVTYKHETLPRAYFQDVALVSNRTREW